MVNDPLRGRITALCRLYQAQQLVPMAHPVRQRQHLRRFSHQRVIGHIGFQAAFLPTAAGRAIQRHLGVAELRAISMLPAINLVALHNPHAHALFDRDHQKILRSIVRHLCQGNPGHAINGVHRSAARPHQITPFVDHNFRQLLIAPQNPFDPKSLNLMHGFTAPMTPNSFTGEAFVLGTDDQGRDVFSTILYGMRISLFVGVAAVTFAMILGITLGLLAGYLGGWTETVIMRVADVQLTFPSILIAMLIFGIARA